MNRLYLVCMTTAAFVFGGSSALWADKESPELARFRKPVEKAVSKGLAFLALQQVTQQQASALGKPTLVGSFAPNKKGNLGISALSVKAFLSKGHTPGHGPYGKVVNRGIDFIMAYH